MVIRTPVVAPPAAASAAAMLWSPWPPTGMRARTTAKPIQPTRSLSMAELMTSMPMSERARFRSIRIFAMTGRAVMLSAMPTKMARGRRRLSGRLGSAPSRVGANQPSEQPMVMGITMPKADTLSIALPWRHTVDRSTSRPTTSSSRVADMRMKPSSAMAMGLPARMGKSQS